MAEGKKDRLTRLRMSNEKRRGERKRKKEEREKRTRERKKKKEKERKKERKKREEVRREDFGFCQLISGNIHFNVGTANENLFEDRMISFE